MKKLASILLTVAVATSVMSTSVFAQTGKTVTFNGGHIYQAEQGKPGTIKLDITNIDSQANVKMDMKELLTYLDDEKTANDIIYTDEDGKGFSINSIVEDLNNKGGVPVYYASTLPVITAKTPLTAFMAFWKGDDATKATFTPKYWSFNDYLANEDEAKVYTTQPDGDCLYAPNTVEQINKTGRYLVVVHDNGAISNSPLSILCLNVGESTPVVKDTTQLDNATEKVKQAVNKRTFYNYIMAYIDILNLPADQQGALLNQLAPVFNDANTPKVQKARTMLETVAKDKDGKIYAETEAYLTGISSSEMDEFTKGYLLGELTSWGKQFVFTSDYVKALDSLNAAWTNKDSKSISEAETLIGQVVNSASKSYLLGELNNLKITLK